MKTLRVPAHLKKSGLPDTLQLHELMDRYKTLAKKRGTGGDMDALRWARKQLRASGLLKSVTVPKNVTVPLAADLLLGPDLYMCKTSASVDDVWSACASEGVPALICKQDDHVVVVLSAEVSEVGEGFAYSIDMESDFSIEKGTVPQPTWKNGILAYDRTDRIPTDIVECETFKTDLLIRIGTLELEEVALLRAHDEAMLDAQLVKVDKRLGLLIGWAIICKMGGEEYYDTQGDHITEDCMVEACLDFMINKRQAGEMHFRRLNTEGRLETVDRGTVAFAMPLTEDIKKALGVTSNISGLVVGLKPNDPEIVEKYLSGEYTGFSIGGRYYPEYIEEVK